jgi:hypothetical protein
MPSSSTLFIVRCFETAQSRIVYVSYLMRRLVRSGVDRHQLGHGRRNGIFRLSILFSNLRYSGLLLRISSRCPRCLQVIQ